MSVVQARHHPSTPTDNIWAMMFVWRQEGRLSELFCVVLYTEALCTVISTLRWAVLTVLWIGFCLTGPISLCVDLFVFLCFILHRCCINVSTVGWTWWDWSLILRTISSFSALTLLVGSLTRKTIPDMTYNVFSGTLTLLNQSSKHDIK